MKKAKELLDEQSLTGEEVAMMEAWKKQEADFYDITAGYYQRGIKQGLQQGMQKGMTKGIQQGMQQGIQQGMQQGMQQGRIQEKSEIIMTMAKTMSPESIAAALEMSVTSILAILNKNQS